MTYIKNNLFIVICLGIYYNGFAQSPGELYKSSVEYTTKGNYQVAFNYINRALEADSSKAEYILQKAQLYYYLKKYDDAVRYCYAVQRREPDNPKVYLLRGQIGVITKSYGGALYLFGKVIKSSLDKDCLCKAYLYRGRVYLETDKLNEALADFNSANAIKADSLDILISYAELYVKMKQTDEAILKAQKAIAKNPKYAYSHRILGTIYYQKKEYVKALESLNKYCELNPNDSYVFRTISEIYLETKELDKALIAIGQASRLEPTESLNYKILGNIYFEKGMRDESCNSIFRAFQNGYLEKYGCDLLELYLKNCEGQ